MKALLIVNPVSGKRRITGELVEIISRLEKGGYVTTVHVTERRGDATETARMHGGEYDMIVCCGGDGTAQRNGKRYDKRRSQDKNRVHSVRHNK